MTFDIDKNFYTDKAIPKLHNLFCELVSELSSDMEGTNKFFDEYKNGLSEVLYTFLTQLGASYEDLSREFGYDVEYLKLFKLSTVIVRSELSNDATPMAICRLAHLLLRKINKMGLEKLKEYC